MKNLTLIFLAIATLVNLFLGFGANLQKRSLNTTLENQNFLLQAFKGDISFEPIKALFASKKAQRRDVFSGLGKSPKDNLKPQEVPAFAIFYNLNSVQTFTICPTKPAPKLSIFKSEFSNTTFLI